MAEAHPVGFRWVMKAKERGARVIHVDPRFSRTSQLADLHVPIRAGTDVAFLGGIIRHVIETESYFKEYVVNYTNACDDRRRALPRHRGPRRRVLGLRPRDRNLRPDLVDVRGLPRSTSRLGAHEHATQAFSEHTGAGMLVDGVEHDETLEHPRCVFQILRRHFARYTPEMVQRICGISPRAVHGGGGCADRQLGARAHERVLLRERVDAALRGCADDPHRGDPPVAAGQCRPARRRHHGDARARVDPGLDRHPDPVRPAARLPAHAARSRGSPDARGVHRRRQGGSRLVVVSSTPTSSRCSRRGSARPRPRRTITASAGCRSSPATTPTSRRCSARSTAGWRASS